MQYDSLIFKPTRCLLAIVQFQRICFYYTNTRNVCYYEYKTSQCTDRQTDRQTDRPFNTVQFHRQSLTKYRKETLRVAGALENQK